MIPRTLIEVVYADGSSFDQVLEGDAIVVGAAAHADLQIRRAPEVEDEHLLIMPRQNGCWVSSARGSRVRPLVGGAFFENGLLPYGTEIDIGSVTLRPRKPSSGKRVKPGPGLLLMALVPVAAFAYLYYKAAARMPRTSSEPPALFGGPPPSCPDAQRPLVRAQDAMLSGDALETQYVYEPQKGMAAVAQLGLAEVCAAAGNNRALAGDARTRREALEYRIDSDFKALRVLLDRSLALDDVPEILNASRALQPYLAHRPGEYADWLVLLERHVEVRAERESQQAEDKKKMRAQ